MGTDALQHWLAQQPALAGTEVVLQPASADASFRRYYRVDANASFAAGASIDANAPGAAGARIDASASDTTGASAPVAAGIRTLIVMDASAERSSCAPFVRIARLLAGAGLHVPQIIGEDQGQGWLLLSDLGRETYLDVIDAGNADALFDAAIDALIALQRSACPADLPRYDAALLRRELELFPEWYLQRHLGLTIDGKLRAQLDAAFELLIERALRQPTVLVHRDFMPRNLMRSEPNPGVLDFQDAVCGPISYDPICLFKDAFISWPEPRVVEWLQRYWQRGRAAGLPLPVEFDAFYSDCDFMGAQRHLKVIGIFARICHRDGKDKYLADVPRFFAYLRGAIERRKGLAGLAALLEKLPGIPA